MKNYSKWKDEDVKKLFSFIESGKEKSQNLLGLFSLFAKLTKRKPNSVRNYYYQELNELEKNAERRQKLGINLTLHKKCEQKGFSENETEKLVESVLSLTSKGYSVRKACLILAKNDAIKMIRYQNKFRSVVLKDKNLYEKCLNNLEIQNPNFAKKRPSNVLNFTNPKTFLTESDINSLFLGLVKLVQKQTQEKTQKECNLDYQKANDELRKMLVKINEKDAKIKNLQKQIIEKNATNQKLCEQMQMLRSQNVNVFNEKNQKLKNFSQKLAKTKLAKNENIT
jgi:hypothetical protein